MVQHVFDKMMLILGDLGHVTLVTDPQVEEGDCRYLPVEILKEVRDNIIIQKAYIWKYSL